MGKPSHELLPRRTPSVPILLSQEVALGLVAIKEAFKFGGDVRIENHRILLIVEPQAAGVEVGTSHSAELTVNHYYFCMMESGAVEIDVASMLHQFVYIVEHAVGS